MSRFVPMSALDGDMVVDRGDRLRWYDGPTLLQILETAELPRALVGATVAVSGAIRRAAGRDAAARLSWAGSNRARSPSAMRSTVLPSGRTTRVRDDPTYEWPRSRRAGCTRP